MLRKGDIRRHFRDRIAAKTDLEPATARLNQALLNGLYSKFDKFVTKVVAGYQALPGEPDLSSSFAELSRAGFDLVFPVVSGVDLCFYRLPAGEDYPNVTSDSWTRNSWGIREPDPTRCECVAIHSLNLILVPGLAFDRQGVRLGRGKGFYDRALQNFQGIKIGVAFEEQITDQLPVEAHDVHMDWIVTENGVLEPSGARSGDPKEMAGLERKGS